MRKSPISTIRYDEDKSVLIIKSPSQDMLEKLHKELKREIYEVARDHGVSQGTTVDIVSDAIHLSGNLNVPLAHVSSQEYVDLNTVAKLRAQITWAKWGAQTLMSPPRPLPTVTKTGEAPVIIHTLKRTGNTNKTPLLKEIAESEQDTSLNIVL